MIPADPYAAAFSALGTAAAGAPSSAATGAQSFGSAFNADGWTVSTGQGTARGGTVANSGAPGANVLPALAGGLDLTSLAVVGLLALVLFKVLK